MCQCANLVTPDLQPHHATHVRPDLQSGVIETRICNPHQPQGKFRRVKRNKLN